VTVFATTESASRAGRRIEMQCKTTAVVGLLVAVLLTGVSAHAAQWEMESVATHGNVGYQSSLALDQDGHPHITFCDYSTGFLEYAYHDGVEWQRQTLDTHGSYSSLALDDAGHPHIAYRQWDANALNYMYWDGSDWQIEAVDANGQGGTYASLVLDEQDQVHISYCQWSVRDLMYAYRDASGWHCETVDSDGTVGVQSSLALDQSGRPHITYCDYSTGYLEYAYHDGSHWQRQTLDTHGSYSSLALDGADHPHVAYRQWDANSLNFMYWDGSDWQIEVVDDDGQGGAHMCLALDVSSQPHVSYCQWSEKDLMYAYRDASGWHKEVVDWAGQVGLNTSLALDGSGQPHVSYFDDTNDDLRYAYAYALRPDVSGTVAGPDGGLLGVPVELVDAGQQVFGSTATDETGYYLFEEVPNGDYTVSIVAPLGYTADDETKEVTVAGADVICDFYLEPVQTVADPRSAGFWKHQLKVYLTGHGTAQIPMEDFLGYLALIGQHFNNNPLNPVALYTVEPGATYLDSLEAAYALLNTRDRVSVTHQAKRQLMALLLNVASDMLPQFSLVSADGATASQAITYCWMLIDDEVPLNDETAKDIGDQINNGILVPPGVIPTDTDDISYGQPGGGAVAVPETFVLHQNHPNPVHPVTTIRYGLQEGRHVLLTVHNLRGEWVAELVNEHQGAGCQSVSWNAAGQPAGVYFYRLSAGDWSATRTLTVVK
jgi:hypothetical protein